MPLLETDLGVIGSKLAAPAPLLVIHDPDDPDAPYRFSQEFISSLAGRGAGDHPRVGPVGALPDPAAPGCDQRRRRFHRSRPVIGEPSATLSTWISYGASSR